MKCTHTMIYILYDYSSKGISSMEENLLLNQEDGGSIPSCPIIIKYTTKYATKYTNYVTKQITTYKTKYMTRSTFKFMTKYVIKYTINYMTKCVTKSMIENNDINQSSD